MCLNIIRECSKVSLTKAQSKMMICIRELVLSVKGKITRLSVSPRRFVLHGPYQKRKRPKRKGRETSRMEGLSWKSEKRDRSWEKIFEGEATESISHMVRQALNDDSSFIEFGFLFFSSFLTSGN